ncbi:MAG: hypothetical protein N4A49_14760 [Marinifilaceae bacterium]|jgi:predicted transcriptional regulator|nr:hypothetical protein [Marinifilaceae bacterium]
MKNNKAFKVPEDYFDNLNQKLDDKINEDNIKVPIRQMIKPYLWMAACIVGVFLMAKITMNLFVSEADENLLVNNTSIVIADSSKIEKETDDSFFSSGSDFKDTSSEELIEYLSDCEISDDSVLALL